MTKIVRTDYKCDVCKKVESDKPGFLNTSIKVEIANGDEPYTFNGDLCKSCEIKLVQHLGLMVEK